LTTTDHLLALNAALLDRYHIERELGRGGMATVYLAQDLRHDRPVALKVLDPALAASVGGDRFLQEVRLTARLQHPHILPLLDSGLVDLNPRITSPFYVMPYVEGESVRDRLRRERQLSVDEALRFAGDVASALAYAHDHGVIHRDVKPDNILVSAGQAVLADFGVARALTIAGGERLTSTGLALGTVHYMSPEQAAGSTALDGRSDVYALGCVLYEMLAGDPPFTGPTAQAIVARSMVDPVGSIRTIRPTVPEAVEHIIARALAKTPADRYANAAELETALAQARAPAAVPAARTRRAFPWRLAAAAAVLLLGAAGLFLRPRGQAPEVVGSASSIAVLPFTPSVADTALLRLGRDLVFTLSAALDGLGGIKVVDAHTVLARIEPGGATTLGEGAALVRRLGAGSMVHGSLVRDGQRVRLDLALVGTDSAAAPLARATVSAPPDSVAALTDSAARVLVAQIWSRGTPPTPSLDGALRTSSVPALRDFLQGERELAFGAGEEARVSYERAILADPEFWLAYSRYVYASYWSLHPVADSLVDALVRHAVELPERERLTTETIRLLSGDSVARVLEVGRAAGERYPSSWFGWLIYGDALLHWGPHLGRSRDEASRAFERALELNPDLIPAWEHLMILALQEGDTALATRALESLERLDAGPTLTADGYGNRILQFRFLRAIQRGDTRAVVAMTDSIARDVASPAVADASFYDPYSYGFFPEQIAVSRAVIAQLPSARHGEQGLMLTLSWGGRGAWDSAVAGMDRMAAEGGDSLAPLRAYGLTVLGAWLGALDPDQALQRREAASSAASRAGAPGAAELGWLDGVLAVGRNDRGGLAAARGAVRRSGDPAAASLERSLGAFESALAGDTRQAGAAMASLEWEQAAISTPDFEHHPFTLPTDRLAAARWLASTGNAEQALRLLLWVDGPFALHPSGIYSSMLAPLVDLERARIEAARGRAEPASAYYRRFLKRYDLPSKRHLPLVEEARSRP
jgi:TolB-like protein